MANMKGPPKPGAAQCQHTCSINALPDDSEQHMYGRAFEWRCTCGHHRAVATRHEAECGAEGHPQLIGIPTPRPWSVDWAGNRGRILGPDRRTVASAIQGLAHPTEESEANLRLAATCVNALDGMNPEAVGQLKALLTEAAFRIARLEGAVRTPTEEEAAAIMAGECLPPTLLQRIHAVVGGGAKAEDGE